jgi:hypothetical protein
LSSTGFVLANEGSEYVILQPAETADSFTVTLEPATYEAQWFSVDSRETLQGDRVAIDSRAAISFSPASPMRGPCVLVLTKVV